MSEKEKPINVVSTINFPKSYLDQLSSISKQLNVVQYDSAQGVKVPDNSWSDVEILYTWNTFPDLQIAPKLKWIQLDTAGSNQIQNTPLWNSEIIITTLTGIAPPQMAEYALMAMLSFAHHIPSILDNRIKKYWPPNNEKKEKLTANDLRGSTVGVIGYGSIGREVGRLSHAFGLKVIAIDLIEPSISRPLTYILPDLKDLSDSDPDLFYLPDKLEEALPKCDYVIVTLPFTQKTHHFIDEHVLKLMKPTSFLINIARGGLVNEPVLIRALQEKWIAGAALDVFEKEPLPLESPLWDLKNVILSPHVAGFTSHNYERVVDLFSQNLLRYLAKKPLLNQVDRKRGY